MDPPISGSFRASNGWPAPTERRTASVLGFLLHQGQVASLAGTTRPTANRILKDAAQAGAIQLGRGHLLIVDIDILNRARF